MMSLFDRGQFVADEATFGQRLAAQLGFGQRRIARGGGFGNRGFQRGLVGIGSSVGQRLVRIASALLASVSGCGLVEVLDLAVAVLVVMPADRSFPRS